MGVDDGAMTYFESLIHEAVRLRQAASGLSGLVRAIGYLYEETRIGQEVEEALSDPFFPLTLFAKHHLRLSLGGRHDMTKAAHDLALLSRMFLRIRKDIDRTFGNREVTCVDLNGDANQGVMTGQWCSLCGECCQLPGTVPDPPGSVRYPGYWYTYISGDSPLIQRFCPFLFELPPQGLFFCAIHHVKPLTCLAYEKADCEKNHPGMAH